MQSIKFLKVRSIKFRPLAVALTPNSPTHLNPADFNLTTLIHISPHVVCVETYMRVVRLPVGWFGVKEGKSQFLEFNFGENYLKIYFFLLRACLSCKVRPVLCKKSTGGNIPSFLLKTTKVTTRSPVTKKTKERRCEKRSKKQKKSHSKKKERRRKKWSKKETKKTTIKTQERR